MIYLDNSATTRPAPEVVRAVSEHMENCFGNPSSRHGAGIEAEKRVRGARGAVAAAMGVRAEEIFFTSGGTEADNIALFGAANLKKGRRVVTTAVEHPAVEQSMKRLEALGFEVIRVGVQKDGRAALSDIEAAVNEKTCLVSVMHVNNETGAIMPVDQIKPILEKKAPRALLHADAVQSFGKIPFLPAKWGIDLASVSGHKIHAPKGIGALYVRRGATVHSPVCGGGQEGGVRPGTENTDGIWGMKTAVGLLDPGDGQRVRALKAALKAAALSLPDCAHNGGEEESPYILNLSFGGVRSEVLLNALSAQGVCVSSKSACSSMRPRASRTLAAMGVKNADGAIRFSFSRYNTMDEIEEAAALLKKLVRGIRGEV